MATLSELIKKQEVTLEKSGASKGVENYETDKGILTIESYKDTKTGIINSKYSIDTITKIGTDIDDEFSLKGDK